MENNQNKDIVSSTTGDELANGQSIEKEGAAVAAGPSMAAVPQPNHAAPQNGQLQLGSGAQNGVLNAPVPFPFQNTAGSFHGQGAGPRQYGLELPFPFGNAAYNPGLSTYRAVPAAPPRAQQNNPDQLASILSQLRLTADNVEFHGREIGTRVHTIMERTEAMDTRLNSIELQLDRINTQVQDLAASLQQLMTSAQEARPPVAGAAGFAVDAALNGQVPFVTFNVEGREEPYTLMLSQAELDGFLSCRRPRMLIRRILTRQHRMSEIQRFVLTENPTNPDDNNAAHSSNRQALPSFTYELIRAAVLHVFRPPRATREDPDSYRLWKITQEQDIRRYLSKLLQYFRRNYHPDGTKIRVLAPPVVKRPKTSGNNSKETANATPTVGTSASGNKNKATASITPTAGTSASGNKNKDNRRRGQKVSNQPKNQENLGNNEEEEEEDLSSDSDD